jgi:hypothetical protein
MHPRRAPVPARLPPQPSSEAYPTCLFAGADDDLVLRAIKAREKLSRVLISGRASLVERRDRLQRH